MYVSKASNKFQEENTICIFMQNRSKVGLGYENNFNLLISNTKQHKPYNFYNSYYSALSDYIINNLSSLNQFRKFSFYNLSCFAHILLLRHSTHFQLFG